VLSAYFWTGREAEAQGLCEKAEPLAPGPVYMFKAEYSLLKGDVVRAKEYMEKAERLIPSSTRLFGVKGAIAAKAGDHDGALAVVREIESKMGSGMGPVGYNYMAYIYNALGDANSFYDCMNKAIDLHADTPSAIMYSPLLAKAREDPRYPGLLARLRR
jgi:lipopolysaccharide biosynthesis regulator YciM